MKVVCQRVSKASVTVSNHVVGAIEHGYVLLVGICQDDQESTMLKMANKIANIRLFSDEQDKMNLNIHQVKGSILSISQFTLCASTKKGNRPSFDQAERPEAAKVLFERFNQALINEGLTVKTGEFQAMMEVSLVNDGPVTIVLEMEG